MGIYLFTTGTILKIPDDQHWPPGFFILPKTPTQKKEAPKKQVPLQTCLYLGMIKEKLVRSFSLPDYWYGLYFNKDLSSSQLTICQEDEIPAGR